MARKYWKVFCKEDEFPGLWRRWFESNCVALGWGPNYGFRLDGSGRSWGKDKSPRKRLLDVVVGDFVVVHLPELRVARIGIVVGVYVQDREWSPLAPPTIKHPDGEFGRRITARWDSEIGPSSPDQVVKLPGKILGGATPKSIAQINEKIFLEVVEAMKQPANWVEL